MTNKIVIAEGIEAGTELIIEDFTLTKYEGEAIVEVHYNFQPIKQYHVCFYPEHWESAQDAINDRKMVYVVKVVYHLQPETV